jgi:hypothetical protein
MPRIDDYKQALKLSAGKLADKDPDLVGRLSGAEILRDEEGRIRLALTTFGQRVTIAWPDFTFAWAGDEGEIPIQQQVLILHYLLGAWSSKGAKPTGEWVSFQEIPDGRFYMDAFQRRA